MAITPLPTPPSRSQSPATFSTDADAFLGALPDFATEANALAADVNADEASAAAAAIAAANSATAAVGAANYRGPYNAATTYQIGQSVDFGGSVWVARTINTGITPAAGANWLNVTPVSTPSAPLLFTTSAPNVLTTPISSQGNPNFTCLQLDGQRDLLVWSRDTGIEAVVWNYSTDTCGSVVLIRSVANAVVTAALSSEGAVIASLEGAATALEVVALTISGTTITVGTPATATVAGSILGGGSIGNVPELRSGGMVAYGNSFVFSYYDFSTNVVSLRGCSVSGGVITLGAAVVLAGTRFAPLDSNTVLTSGSYHMFISAGQGLAVTNNAGTLTLTGYTITGATVGLGTPATIASATGMSIARFPSGRVAMTYSISSQSRARIATVSGSITLGAEQTLDAAGFSGSLLSLTDGRIGCMYRNSARFVILSDGTTTLNLSANITPNTTGSAFVQVGNLVWQNYATNTGNTTGIDVSGADPVIQVVRRIKAGSSASIGGIGESGFEFVVNFGSYVTTVLTDAITGNPSAAITLKSNGLMEMGYFPAVIPVTNGLARLANRGPRAYVMSRRAGNSLEVRRIIANA